MANQIIVTQSGNVQVSIEPTPNVQVQISRAAIGTVSNVPTANFANYAANVTSSSQPNITSLGTLSNLSVSGNTTLNNLIVTGNLSIGNLVANSANYANFAGVANTANTVAGANVTGTVANATFATNAGTSNSATVANTANSVTLANVSGAGNIASINLDGNVANLLTGNGTFVAIPTVSANANYANFANVANIANSVAVANVSGIGNIATVNLDGNSSNVLYGNGVFATISIPAGDQISNGTSNVSIPVANGNVQVYANNQHWTFTDVGNLLLAGGNSVVQSIANSSLDILNPNVSTMVLTPDQGYISQALVLDPTLNGHIHLRAPGANIDQPVANLYLGGEASSFEVGQFNGAVPNLFIHSNNQTWRFDIDGNLTLPGNTFAVNYANGTQVPLDGPVANANYANFAGTAYSVDGANVSGEVANANYSAYAGNANVANVANSVAVANVSGIGNIATINLDGSSSNVLFGNGVFAPESTSIANANYANFAGTLINGNSNITIAANSSILISAVGNANVVTVDGNGSINSNPLNGGYNNWLRLNNYGTTANGASASRISSFRYRGSSGANLSVQPNDSTIDIVTLGYNGSILQTSSLARIRANVDNSYIANGANIPLGWQIQVNDTNGGINNQAKIHNFYSNGNVTFANSVFVTDSFTSGGNITSNIGTFIGNGAGLTNLTGANVTGTVANATYANNAGNASAIGNIANLNIISSNTSLPTDQFNTTGIVVGSTANANLQANSLQVVVDYGNGQGDSNSALTKGISYVKARGTSASPTTAVANDIIKRENYLGYNGASNVLYATTTANATTINANANAVWGSGSYQINTGSTTGDLGNANALSAYNSFNFLSTGQLVIQPGSNSTPANMLNIISYGQPTNLPQAQGVTFSKARGNRDANLSVNANDILGRLTFQGYNGSSFVTNRLPIIRGVVDSTYVANAANIPAGLQMIVCDSNTNYTHNFYANGATVLSGNLQAIGGNFQVNKTTANATSFYLAGDKTTNSSFDMYDAQFSVTMSNVNTTTGFSPFRFQQYAPTSSEFGPMYYYRARGTDFFTSAPVVANDKVMSYNFIVNSNNTTTSIGQFDSTVTYNDNAGNVGMKFDFNATGTGTTGYLNGAINLLANTTSANNFTANTVSVGTGSNNITLNGTTGYITYNKSFGNFTSNVTQTNSNVGNAVYMTLNNNEGSNGVSIVSNSQITTSRTGNYNIQFSAQMEKTDGGTDTVEIWLTKNGSSVANSATRLQIQGTNEKDVAAWNWLVNSANVNDYYQIAWASTDANMQLVAIGSGSTLSGVAVPSLIVTVVPVGA